LGDLRPDIHESAFIAAEATIIGQATLAAETSVWPNAVLRADNEPIVVGRGTNIQEGSVLHTDPGFPLTIGVGCTIGHRAVLHGCTIGDNSLIGMGAVLLNGAKIGKNSIVGAGALVTEGKEFPDNSLIVGSPGRAIRTLDEKAESMLRLAAKSYTDRWPRYAQSFKRAD